LNLDECKRLMSNFIQNHPQLWHEDIGKWGFKNYRD
jgi:hypothetical protein